MQGAEEFARACVGDSNDTISRALRQTVTRTIRARDAIRAAETVRLVAEARAQGRREALETAFRGFIDARENITEKVRVLIDKEPTL